MNESQLKSMLTEFAEPVTFRPPQRRPYPWKFVVASAAGICAVTAVFLMTPRVSEAAQAVHRMELALANVSTMTCDQYIHYGDRPDTWAMHTDYAHGAWKMRSRIGTSMEITFLVRDGVVFRYDKKHGSVVREPYQGWLGNLSSALEFAKQQTNFGLTEPPQVHIEDSPAMKGRPTYTLVMERAEDEYYTRILVDRQTDLPILSETSVRYGKNEALQHVRMVYNFSPNLTPSQFDPASFGPPIIDLRTAMKAFLEESKRPMAAVGETQIHRVEATPTGTVYVLTSCPKDGDTRAVTASGGDSSTYCIAGMTSPGGTWGDTDIHTLEQADGRSFSVTTFVPVDPGKIPQRLRIGVGPAQAKVVETGHATLPVTRIRADRPAYTAALIMDQAIDQVRISQESVRADWFRDHDRFEEELKYRWRAYHEAVAFIPRFGELRVSALATCLRKLGRDEEADRVIRELGPQPVKRFP